MKIAGASPASHSHVRNGNVLSPISARATARWLAGPEPPPFVSLDREGVGELVSIAVERGRKTRNDLKLGICGEHGGDPDSIAFCHEVGLDYVSCSPFRVPIARLAAAQAALGKAPASQA